MVIYLVIACLRRRIIVVEADRVPAEVMILTVAIIGGVLTQIVFMLLAK